MGIYVTTKCGSCGKTWQSFHYGGNSICGAPYIKCYNCKNLNTTKMDLFRNFSFNDKVSFFFTEILFGSLFGLIGLIIGCYFFNTFFIEQNFFNFSLSNDPWYWILIGKLFVLIICLGPIFFGLQIIYNKITTYFQINKMEKTYDKQGGFLWSNQQY